MSLPPLSVVLPGVTRQKVIELIKRNHMEIEEKLIRPADLSNYDACFITSTSAKVLPVASINRRKTDVNNKHVKTISALYNSLINKYLQNFRWPDR